LISPFAKILLIKFLAYHFTFVRTCEKKSTRKTAKEKRFKIFVLMRVENVVKILLEKYGTMETS